MKLPHRLTHPPGPQPARSRAHCHPLVKLAASAALVTLALCGGSIAIAAPVAFDIPAQPLDRALALFARQAGLQLALPAALAQQGRTSPALQGHREPADALTLLVPGSGLRWRVDGNALEILTTANVIGRICITIQP